MTNKWTTLTEFILKEEQSVPAARGSLTLLLSQIGEGAKIIASHVKNSGLVGIEGASGNKNSFSEEVQKLDEFSNDLLIDIMAGSGQVSTIVSEEMDKPVHMDNQSGDYVVFMDPLDGSSNIDVNISVGTIFSIYNKKDGLLQKGSQQVASGYVLYGSSVMFVYTCCNSVNGFTLDPSIGSFLLSHPNIQIPKKSNIYSINEGYYNRYDDNVKKYLDSLKDENNPYKARYVGSMVADVHRTLLKGGIFLYPSNSKTPTGKLRLMLEVNPLALIVERAGGLSLSNKENPLQIVPSDHFQSVPIAMGSIEEVEKYSGFVTKNS